MRTGRGWKTVLMVGVGVGASMNARMPTHNAGVVVVVVDFSLPAHANRGHLHNLNIARRRHCTSGFMSPASGCGKRRRRRPAPGPGSPGSLRTSGGFMTARHARNTMLLLLLLLRSCFFITASTEMAFAHYTVLFSPISEKSAINHVDIPHWPNAHYAQTLCDNLCVCNRGV